ncbi:hypothetical protein [Kamptonema formosum]|uniref:hypothetical protein n=1 Tax=Kamptonema formosum TaxID=331992 RepID=UPI00034D1EE5|nr:hypothetical protein [Oscillatoria sp. PCC 10802]
MKNKDSAEQKYSGFSRGFSAGLKIGLGFTVCFFLLRYPIEWSACYGLLGGLAGGLVTAWWQFGYLDAPVDEIVPKTLANRPKLCFQTRLKQRLDRAEDRRRRWSFGRGSVGRLLGKNRS